jgi:hypothetical protein
MHFPCPRAKISTPMPANFSTLTPKQIIQRTAMGVVALFLVLYLCDLIWFQLRVNFPKLGVATGSVHRFRMLAIPIKNGKVDYEPDTVQPEEDVPCAHSLFPHSGKNPCSYVTRHANDPIAM